MVINKFLDNKRQIDEPEMEQVMKTVDKTKVKNKKKTDDHADELGLGVAQIVITAATPMEEIERPFPGENEESESTEEAKEPQENKAEIANIKEEQPKEIKEIVEETPEVPEEVEEKSTVDDLPADSAPFPISSSSGSEADSTSGPSTGDNSTSLPSRGTVIEMQMESNETSDEQPEIIPEKMLIGGRASIPDELQPDQLEKLQNLKESNA